MSASVPALSVRLDAARRRVRRMVPRAFAVVVGVSVLGLAVTWVAEAAQADQVAGVTAGVLLAVWAVAGLMTFAVIGLLVAGAAASAGLRFLTVTSGTGSSEGGRG